MVNEILREVVAAVVLFIPAAVANMMPVIGNQIPGISRLAKIPLDGGLKLGGNYLFGRSKSLMGLALGFVGGLIGGLIWYGLVWLQVELGFADVLILEQVMEGYVWQLLLSGGAMGLGALLGDLVFSFLKRRVGIKSGRPWPVFDQVDFIIGSWLVFIVLYRDIFVMEPELALRLLAYGCLLVIPLHFLSNVLAYLMGWKKVWW